MVRQSKFYSGVILTLAVLLFLLVWKQWRNLRIEEKRMDAPSSGENDPKSLKNEHDQVLSDIMKLLNRPLRDSTLDPVLLSHIDYLKRNGDLSQDIAIDKIQSLSRNRLVIKSTELTNSETKTAEVCKKKGPSDYQKNYGLFFHNKDTGETRRTHHTYLDSDSLLVEVGGNWGWDAGNFTKLYGMRHVILEPLGEYVKILQKKFKNNPEVSVYELGTGAKNEKLMVAIEGNNACATSKFSKKKGTTPIYLINAVDFFTHIGIGVIEVDLLSMNCEGCEFETLETMLKYNIITKFRNIQWATHTQLKGLPDPFGRYCVIHELLKRTHRPTYQYKFNWESWRRKDLP